MSSIVTPLIELWNTIRQASAETILTMVAIFLVFIIALLWDRIVNGSDASNSYRRHDDNSR